MSKYGAACDNVLSAHMVTVDGRQLEARQNSNPDLFWAIRGGGGNFGVATALEYQLHPVSEILVGALMYPAGRIPELLQAYVKFTGAAPDEMAATAMILPSEQGPRIRMLVGYCGQATLGNDLLKPLRAPLRPAGGHRQGHVLSGGSGKRVPGVPEAICVFRDEPVPPRTQRGRCRGDYNRNQGCAAEVQGDDWAVPRGHDSRTSKRHGISLEGTGL